MGRAKNLPVGGKARNRSGDNAASFGSFLGCRKERPRNPVGGNAVQVSTFYILRSTFFIHAFQKGTPPSVSPPLNKSHSG